MVVGFLIHVFTPKPSINSILFSNFYSTKLNDEDEIKRSTAIIQQVIQDYSFQEKCLKSTPINEGIDSKIKIQIQEKSVNIGSFRIPKGKLFDSPKIVLWKKVYEVFYTLILEKDENRKLAKYFLQQFVLSLNDLFRDDKISSKPRDLFTKAEEVLILVDQTLPGGQLIYPNSYLMKHIQKQTKTLISEKK
ncbi:ap-5 complex subunit sigma-1 [Anaeramoeba ignava]|uniref:Ap-5 complex subunit sigma-1 n=1 Tax=Anaeramoeba ignava TaxID=1746090 RepID=A0A9Q0L6M5_ANAIG|nr:ap-5 complex subunit sigma-1 [Anaeramoeba ignava]